jgi:prepilin signal peptidase PulO-like enzyme (type II secretory pathway)
VFDYDLSTTRGLELGLIDRFQDIVWSTESVKFILAIVGGLVVWFLAKHNIKIELVK